MKGIKPSLHDSFLDMREANLADPSDHDDASFLDREGNKGVPESPIGDAAAKMKSQ